MRGTTGHHRGRWFCTPPSLCRSADHPNVPATATYVRPHLGTRSASTTGGQPPANGSGPDRCPAGDGAGAAPASEFAAGDVSFATTGRVSPSRDADATGHATATGYATATGHADATGHAATTRDATSTGHATRRHGRSSLRVQCLTHERPPIHGSCPALKRCGSCVQQRIAYGARRHSHCPQSCKFSHRCDGEPPR